MNLTTPGQIGAKHLIPGVNPTGMLPRMLS